jgi:transposase
MTKKKYTQEYKAEAVKLWLESGRKGQEVGDRLGIHRTHFLKWHRELTGQTPASQQRFKTQAKGLASLPLNDLAAENARLKRENVRLKTDYEILKKTVAIFSTETRK